MSTIITLAIVGALVVFSLGRYIKMSKNGGCGCGCEGCPSKNACSGKGNKK